MVVLSRLGLCALLVLVLAVLLGAIAPARAAIPVYGYRVVKRYPHDVHAFTEGLFYLHGHLYESTGEDGQSTVRKVDLKTGKVLQVAELPPGYFGEGIVAWQNELIQLTWRHGMGLVYDLKTLKPEGRFAYPGEGWALTRHRDLIYMSDGTPDLRILDAATLQQIGTLQVTADGRPVHNLNELEWVHGQLFANIWLKNRIARIDPATGHVIGWIDLAGLLDIHRLPDPGDDVLNGIAWDAKRQRLFVTGKRWPWLFQIRLTGPKRRSHPRNRAAD